VKTDVRNAERNQALVCDIAYETLLTPWRQKLHQRIAKILEGLPADLAEREPESLPAIGLRPTRMNGQRYIGCGNGTAWRIGRNFSTRPLTISTPTPLK
jgi:hypothetical protein